MTKINVKDKLQDETLDLSLCDLEEVPVREIAVLKRAKHLDLSNNALISLPKTFVMLRQIIKLDLSKNMLTEIPENFGEMVQLKHLDLYSNRISRLPLSLGNLKNLKWLDLKENPLTPAVASVAGPCSSASECQTCARKIVTYLANLKLTVEEEKQRRINAISETEKIAASNKKEVKKKKKNAEKAKVKENAEKSRLFDQVSNQTEKNNGKLSKIGGSEKTTGKSNARSIPGRICGFLCKLILFLLLTAVFFTVLVTLGLILFPFHDEKHSEETFELLETELGLPLRYYRQLGKDMLEKFTNNAIMWSNHFRILVEDYYKQYFNPEVAHLKKST